MEASATWTRMEIRVSTKWETQEVFIMTGPARSTANLQRSLLSFSLLARKNMLRRSFKKPPTSFCLRSSTYDSADWSIRRSWLSKALWFATRLMEGTIAKIATHFLEICKCRSHLDLQLTIQSCERDTAFNNLLPWTMQRSSRWKLCWPLGMQFWDWLLKRNECHQRIYQP